MIIELIDEAVATGAPFGKACGVIGLAPTTVARWRSAPDEADGRRGPKTPPPNALSAEEPAEVVAIMNAPENSSMSPETLVPYLATLGMYLASQSTLYRIARSLKLLGARGRARRRAHRRPREAVAKGPNQVWSWDITFLATTVRGRFLKLYIVIDVWSRMIVGAEVHDVEDDAIAARLIERCCLEQGVRPDQLVLHSDNGGAMKGNTMLAKLQQLGVMPSFSRPRVSDDNPFAESLMRTVKYCPAYPIAPSPTSKQREPGSGHSSPVQRGAPAQRHSLRHAVAAPPRSGHRDPRASPRRVPRRESTTTTPRALDRKDPLLGSS